MPNGAGSPATSQGQAERFPRLIASDQRMGGAQEAWTLHVPPAMSRPRRLARGPDMRMHVAKTCGLAAGLAVSLSPVLAQDASQDRAGLDAAAGRAVFRNVLLADPQAFTRRPPLGTRGQAQAAVASPVSAGDVSMDREALDAGAGRVAFRTSLTAPEPPSGGTPGAKRTAPAQADGKRTVRVVLASPYGQ